MAKYRINEDIAGELEVESDEYTLSNGFFWFLSNEGTRPLTVAADKIVSIRQLS